MKNEWCDMLELFVFKKHRFINTGSDGPFGYSGGEPFWEELEIQILDRGDDVIIVDVREITPQRQNSFEAK